MLRKWMDEQAGSSYLAVGRHGGSITELMQTAVPAGGAAVA